MRADVTHMIWYCQCPEPVTDDYGKRGVCKAAARIVTTSDQESNSGPVLLVRIKCDRNHWNDQLFEDVTLYG